LTSSKPVGAAVDAARRSLQALGEFAWAWSAAARGRTAEDMARRKELIDRMAPAHGNYAGYYARRPSPRVPLFPHSLFPHAAVLDVGANDGHLTARVALALAPRIITGVDIDRALVDAAWRHRLHAWSLASPHGVPSYFPASLPHELGPLPVPPSQDQRAFPHNLAFRCADWTKEDIPEDKDGYDIVLAYVPISRLPTRY
jgi:7SK snRNA methylphosphate capping enzyme